LPFYEFLFWHEARGGLVEKWQGVCYIQPRDAGVNLGHGTTVTARRWLLLLTAFLFMAHTGRTARPPAKGKPRTSEGTAQSRAAATARPASAQKLPKDAEKWVAKALKKMTLEEKIGQVMMVFIFGGFISRESPQYAELLRQIEQNHVGGLVVGTRVQPLGVVRSQVYPTAELINELQGRAKVPLLVGADFERGTAMRLEEGTALPYPMAVAATGRTEDAYTMGKITALEARAAGVQWVFAPVGDVNSNPDNPIINTRSFGEDPQRVSELVAAFVRGVEENGALSTTKHFPGHGDTSTDSHVAMPTITGDRARLERVELAPFRAAIAAGTSTIMTGHLAVPALEPETDVPATMSHKVLTDLLRKEMGFEGLIVTDALDMGGVTGKPAPGEVAVRSFEAGADVLLVPPVPDAAMLAIKEAVASGRVPMARLDESVKRILRAKARLGLHKQKRVSLEALGESFRRPEFVAAAQDVADRGVILLRDEAKQLPLDATRPLRVLLVCVAGDPDPWPCEDLENEIRWRVDALEVVRTDTRFAKVENVKLPAAEKYDVVIAALVVRWADRKGTVSLPADQAALVERLLAGESPVVVAALGSPYLVERFPAAKTWVAALSTFDVAQRAAARAIFGQTAIGGRMPVSAPGVAKLGDGLSLAANPMKLRAAGPELEARLKPAYDVVERAVADGAFPGAVLAVGYKGELAVRAFGRQTYEAKSVAVTQETIYDAASVTKPVVTATLVAMQVAAGRIQLDAPIERYLPEWAAGPNPEWRKRVTVRNLLTHTSGLPAYTRYFLEVKGKREILTRILVEPLVAEPGTQTTYSDLGIILMGEIVERVTGRPLDQLARERIFTPLGMKDSMYNPPKSLLARIAPTENDAAFRKRLAHGEVHDENAWALGGVAPHAGLFTTAPDLAVFCQMMLNGGMYAHQRLLRRSTVTLFATAEKIAGGTRTLGWMVPTEGGSSGKYFSARSYGHTGFTGTSVWIDPEKELFVVLLTNRVHPTRENNKIREVRPAVHDAVVEALQKN